MKIHTKFDIKQDVLIEPIKLKGQIQNIFLSKNDIDYNVRYFYNDKPETIYFKENELSAVTEKAELGFRAQ